jgi:hypothetical protein
MLLEFLDLWQLDEDWIHWHTKTRRKVYEMKDEKLVKLR